MNLCATCVTYKIIHSRSIQVELGKVEGFRETLKARCKMLKWMLTMQSFKCKAESSLAPFATWTNQLVPSRLTLNFISYVKTNQPVLSTYSSTWQRLSFLSSLVPNSTAWSHHPAKLFYNYSIKFSQKSWSNCQWPADFQRPHYKNCSILQVCFA